MKQFGLLVFVVVVVVTLVPYVTSEACDRCVWNPIPVIGNLVEPRRLTTIATESFSESIFVYGGTTFTGRSRFLYDVHKFFISTGTWRKLYTEGNPEMSSGIILNIYDNIYLMGGDYQLIKFNRDIWQFDTESLQWTKLLVKEGEQPSLFDPLRAVAVISFQEFAYVEITTLDTTDSGQFWGFEAVWDFDIKNNSWTKLSNESYNPHFFVPFSGGNWKPFAVAYYQQQVIIAGFSSSTVFVVFNKYLDSWRTVNPTSELPILPSNTELQYVQSKEMLYVLDYDNDGNTTVILSFDLSNIWIDTIVWKRYNFTVYSSPHMAVHNNYIYLYVFPVSDNRIY
jgi:hypothetical protein